MIAYLDYFLDRITMYRLVLYYLIAILLMAVVGGIVGILPYSAISILGSTLVLLIVCGLTNWLFSITFQAPTNFESAYITALILVCILPPLSSFYNLPLLIWAGILAMASKYILAFRNKHLFNPAAIAVVLTAFWLNQSAIWWVGTQVMLPVVLIGGFLMVRKLRRTNLVVSFFIASILTVIAFSLTKSGDLVTVITATLLQSSLFFFAFVMLTEPLTTPPTSRLQIAYGVLVGILFAPQFHLGSLYSTPELALVVGNLFSYLVSPKIRERLTLVSITRLATDVAELAFSPKRHFTYQPGQYMEFTLSHPHSDARGTRRYFTLASSPTEKQLLLGIKEYPQGSSFKHSLLSLAPGSTIIAGQIAGEFTLPTDPSRKLAFLAGGIGITPFRSMIKYLLDTGERRDITLLYMNKTANEIVYANLFSEAERKLGIRTVYTLTDSTPEGWTGHTGRINQEMLQQEIPDFAERIFYLSGPHAMVVSLEQALASLEVSSRQIKKDYFPGLT